MEIESGIGLLCVSGAHGGLEINVVRLARWLTARGRRVVVFCLQDSYIATAARNIPVTVVEMPRHRKVMDVGAAMRLYKHMQHNHIHMLIVCESKDIGIAGIAKTLSGNRFRLVYQQQMQLGVSKRDPIHSWRYRKLDRWISPLKYLKEEVRTRTKYDPRNVRVIPLGMDPSIVDARDVTREHARRKFDIPGVGSVIGILGRIAHGKGHHFLIRSLAHLRSQGCNASLLIVGEPNMGETDGLLDALHNVTKELNLVRHVHFRPFTNDIAQFYRSIDVFAMTTNGETYGMVTIEAMMAGVPVLAVRSPATTELLADGALGWLCDVDDVDGFARQAQIILDDVDTSSRIAQHAQAHAREFFTHTRECNMLEELIAEL